jgi:D-alanyl-D-alanine carboxypeptidase
MAAAGACAASGGVFNMLSVCNFVAQALLTVPVKVNVTTERKNSRCNAPQLHSAAVRSVILQRSCSIDARYYLGDPALYVTGCIPRDSAPYIQVVAAIKSGDFAASLFRAALHQAGVFIGRTTTAACALTTWSWNMKHTSLPLSSLMNHTLQDR